MEARDIALFITALVGLCNITGFAGGAIYIFAVLRTQVQAHEKAHERHDAHAANLGMHFNAIWFSEFEKRMEGEISSLRREIVEVKGYCEEIDQKIDRLKE